MHYSGGGEAMSTTTQRRSNPYPLSRRGRCALMSLSVTLCKPPLTPPSLAQGECQVNSISKLGNGESKVYAS